MPINELHPCHRRCYNSYKVIAEVKNCGMRRGKYGMNGRRIYFDNAATSFPKPAGVAEAVLDFMTKVGSNINRGGYSSAYEAEDTVFDTRSRIKQLFNAPDERNVIFTSNVTMSLNMVIKGILEAKDHVLVSSMEHNAVMRPLIGLQSEKNVAFDRIPCDKQGFADVNSVEGCLKPNTRAVIMTHASNVCGAIEPVAEIGRLLKERGVLFIVDAAQTAGVVDIDMEQMNIDVLCFTGHKSLLGPQGTGGFVIGRAPEAAGLPRGFIEGGTGSVSHLETMPDFLPDKLEAGTLNLPGIYGLNAGLKYIEKTGTRNILQYEQKLKKQFLDGIREIEGVRAVGAEGEEDRYVGVVSLVFEGLDQAKAAFMLDSEFNIQTRVGLHCAPSAHRTLGTYPEGTVRFSFGIFNTEEEVAYGIEAVRSICGRSGL